ncbi:hypothetical protein B0T17DRAFT_106405 [Bombardia bombarda]|uniref:Uncharacterized protein n=1 Tax=Bombardia bombarda TaxID=252184 RepID=A0AA39XPD2_9PEZI|nr:hypothetical protein B0T17DRAFT_106405 [Bombardia bombarda]
MKASTIFASLFATLAVAAPTEKRASFDLTSLNNLNGFNQVNLNYLLNINSLNLAGLNNLGQFNNFDILGFQGLFQAQQFDLQAILQLQQLQMLLQFQQLGLFNGFDLSGLALQQLQLGLINPVGGVDLAQFIPQNVVTQVQTVASQVGSLFQAAPVVQAAPVIQPAAPAVEAAPAAAAPAAPPAPVAIDPNVVTAVEQEAQEGGSAIEKA